MFRSAIVNDADKLDELLTQLILDEKKYDPNVEIVKVKDFYKNYINDNTKFFLVCEENDIIFGYIYVKKEDNILKIDALYVLEEYRNKGIATHLLEEVINYGKLNNYEIISINVLENNLKAKKLYSKYFKLYKKDNIKEELRMIL